MRTSTPTSIDGIQKYLGSGMIRGIGLGYGRKMVTAFAENVFDIIEAQPDRLREVTGIGTGRAKRITEAWAEEKIMREIMVFLHSMDHDVDVLVEIQGPRRNYRHPAVSNPPRQ